MATCGVDAVPKTAPAWHGGIGHPCAESTLVQVDWGVIQHQKKRISLSGSSFASRARVGPADSLAAAYAGAASSEQREEIALEDQASR